MVEPIAWVQINKATISIIMYIICIMQSIIGYVETQAGSLWADLKWNESHLTQSETIIYIYPISDHNISLSVCMINILCHFLEG